ncbi:hypothetical protein [Duganella sp. BJB476]|uniref:hypothetical protein n=1 Tax=Duganella sp. BJB476 TaxID=1871176 RepID=UPI000EBC1391|nr:hypothetical protein [Duganella sp. BJB476]RFP32464.1 hypothetical protein D0T21_09705 [Duganella sp. BJB476]
MSDVMFYGVLRMPYDLAMGDEISRLQFYQVIQQAADRVERADALRTAVAAFIKAKGRYHTEQGYKALVEAFDAGTGETPP